MKRFLSVLICLYLLACENVIASHMIGGDITYVCLGNNRFRVTVSLFQDCLNGQPLAIEQDNPVRLAIYEATQSPRFVQSVEELSTGKEIISPNFSNECVDNFPNTCLQKTSFVFEVTLPPSDFGYYITYQRCCRNAQINNIINPGNIGVTYWTRIPPFKNGECTNNSAYFKSLPPQIICTNNPFFYDFSVIDPDADSISYELCNAYIGGSAANPIPTGPQITPPPYRPVNYRAPYSALEPVVGNPSFVIHPQTGIMTGTPISPGRYVVSVCATEWKDGIMKNILQRDLQFVITDCSKSVLADIPILSTEANTFKIICDGYAVDFVNNSRGGFEYFWDFGVPGGTSREHSPSFTYPDTGTYLVKLVVNQGSTCADSIYRYVKVYPFFTADFQYDGKLCPNEEIQFTDLSNSTVNKNAISWFWNFGDGTTSTEPNPIKSYAKPGGKKTVQLIVKNETGCVDTASISIPVSEFFPSAGNDTIIILNDIFYMQGEGSQFYRWSPPDYLSDPTIANPLTSFPTIGSYPYTLYSSNEEGCEDIDSVTIRVVRERGLFVPNAFSPNGDGLNDVVIPQLIGYRLLRDFSIYNRWGERVFSAFNINQPKWDGTYKGEKLEVGTYFWSAKILDINNNEIQLKGDINLIR